MSAEDEFSKWLRRKECTFAENLKFAIKSWQSLELTLLSKYEVILQWISEQSDLKDNDIVEEDFKELLKLRAQPGLISQQVKEAFIEWCLLMAAKYDHTTRKWCDLLALLVEFELLQDLYRANYKLHARVFGSIFCSYEKYLEKTVGSDTKTLNTPEIEFFAAVLNNIKDTIKRCADVELYEAAFTALTLNDLVNALLVMRTLQVNFFEEFLEIERLLCLEFPEDKLVKRIMQMPLHVRLLTLECSIVNRRGIETFLQMLLGNLFQDLLANATSSSDPTLNMTMAAYVLEMLGRHDVNLNFKINEKTSLQFLGQHIYHTVNNGIKNGHLKEVLMVLCAALRLNPLILEENVFAITAQIILTPKSGDIEEQQLFEEYLVSLMDMFRKLSRAEKFVSNLLKTLNESLNKTDAFSHKKRKLKQDLDESSSKKRKTNAGEANEQKTNGLTKYLNILFCDFFKPILTKQKTADNSALSASNSFAKLQNFWPSNPVGVAFSKIITGLISKPSIVIWKTLLHALKELLSHQAFNQMKELDEKALFQLDLHVAMLTQYFAGCKLAEQSEKFLQDIKTQREFTFEILQLFGKFILEREHQPRTIAAFLEFSYFATSFELMLIFYKPDGCEHEALQPAKALEKLHAFLTVEEWTLIQQRVLNFGKSSCIYLLQRLQLQKSQSSLLLLGAQHEKLNVFSSFTTSNTDNLFASLLKAPNASWLLKKLTRDEKAAVACFIVQNTDLLYLTFEDLELLEFVALAAYEQIATSIPSKQSLLKSLNSNIAKVRQTVESSECETLIRELIAIVNERSGNEYKVKQVNSADLKANLNLLSQLPIGHLRRQRKTIIFALHLSLYCDLKLAKEDDLAAQTLEIMKDILHFGQQVLIFKYFTAQNLMQLLPPETCWELYEFIFSTIKYEEKGTDQFLLDLADVIKSTQSLKTTDVHCKLLLHAIETLSSLSGPCAKRMRKHYDLYLEIFSKLLKEHFNAVNDVNAKKHKKFVQATLAGFAPYASSLLTKAAKAKESKEPVIEEIDEDFRRISKIYIGHSMDYRNPHAIRLLQLALNHRELLHLDQDEIEFVLTNYWTQINEDLKEPNATKDNKTIESAVKMIIGNKTNEDLLITLKTMVNNVDSTNFCNILKLLNLIAKCPFSTIKGAIFNEQYKQISFNITLRLARDEQQQFKDNDLLINLLQSHHTILDNKMIPLSADTMDSILSFLMDINIKKFSLSDSNLKVFHSLHLAMTNVCCSLIKQRHVLLMDRVPQFVHIFKDLTQSVVWYKSNRQKDTALPSEELDNLAELAMKLEALMHLIAEHSVEVKRVAPFVLTFIINLMVSNKRPTTLYTKIKTHIESICYDLVGICDHRVGRFILRCSNEAGRQLYELMVKDYQKYHKFKGKV